MSESAEISIYELVQSVWKEWRFILKITIGGAIFGVLIALTSPITWDSRAEFLPESQSPGINSSLGSLAGFAGINLDDQNSQYLSPELYPSLVSSTSFLLELANRSFYFSSLEKEMPYGVFLKTESKKSLFDSIKDFLGNLRSLLSGSGNSDVGKRDNNILALSIEDEKMLLSIKESILIKTDKKSGLISVSVTVQDRYASAQIVNYILDYITNYIIDYSISSERRQLEFIQSQYKLKAQDFELKQMRLAEFEDSNVGLATAKATSERERLVSEKSLAFNLYSSMAQKLEEARIKLEEKTPVMHLIDSAKIPAQRSAPKRTIILFIYTFLGIIVGAGIVGLKFFLKKLPNQQ